jgi:hypothetical protein
MRTGRVTARHRSVKKRSYKSRTLEAVKAAVPSPLLHRDLGALAFNARVLDMARHADVPLLERLRYLCIVSSNLDEFFEIRVSDALDELRRATPGLAQTANAAAMRDIALAAHALVDQQYTLYNDQLTPALGERVLRARGAAPAGAGESGPISSVSAGGEQVAALHRAPEWPRRLRS